MFLSSDLVAGGCQQPDIAATLQTDCTANQPLILYSRHRADNSGLETLGLTHLLQGSVSHTHTSFLVSSLIIRPAHNLDTGAHNGLLIEI